VGGWVGVVSKLSFQCLRPSATLRAAGKKFIDLPAVERKKRERTPSSNSSHSRSSSCSSTESRRSARTYRDKVVDNRPPTPGTLRLLQEEANAPLALHPRKSEERDLLKTSEKGPQRPQIRNPNRQDYKATDYMAHKEDARRRGDKKNSKRNISSSQQRHLSPPQITKRKD
jgi:hypothetical protein